MSERKNCFDSNMPASVAQARELWEEVERLSAQIKELHPLLALLEPTEVAAANDPIAKLVELLEGISASQRSLEALVARCDQKLTYLITLLTEGR